MTKTEVNILNIATDSFCSCLYIVRVVTDLLWHL